MEQSRPVEAIVDEVTELVSQGFKEVTLLGQNIDAYGRDMIPKRKFSDLLKIVGSVNGLERLRFVTVSTLVQVNFACLLYTLPLCSHISCEPIFPPEVSS